MFARGSRYEQVAQDIHTDPSGRQIVYVLLRLIPDVPVQQVHTVAMGERLDLIANHYFADPEQFWRICDANQVLRPADLTELPGQRLLIPQVTR
jgi:hypothetical protein